MFLGIVVTLLVLDLGVLHREHREIRARESLVLSAVYIGLGLSFGLWVWWSLGAQSGMEYLTGFAVEKALAMDNVFVIAMIFSSSRCRPNTSTACCSGASSGLSCCAPS